MENFKLFIKKQGGLEELDREWVTRLLDSDAVENGPRDLMAVEDNDTMLTLSFCYETGLYYAMGRLDRQKIYSYRLGKLGSMKEINRKLSQRRFMKDNNYKDVETANKIFVKALDPSNAVDEDRLWRRMNCLNDLCSVCVKANGRYAFLSYATPASVHYVVGYFENDTYYDVQLKKEPLRFYYDENEWGQDVEDWGNEVNE